MLTMPLLTVCLFLILLERFQVNASSLYVLVQQFNGGTCANQAGALSSYNGSLSSNICPSCGLCSTPINGTLVAFSLVSCNSSNLQIKLFKNTTCLNQVPLIQGNRLCFEFPSGFGYVTCLSASPSPSSSPTRSPSTFTPSVSPSSSPSLSPTTSVPSVSPTFPDTACAPKFGLNMKQCKKKIRKCGKKKIKMKFNGMPCVESVGMRSGKSGCQCDQYCGYPCKEACESDKQCYWENEACYNAKTKTIGIPMLFCPTTV